jgi:hypothetical protein
MRKPKKSPRSSQVKKFLERRVKKERRKVAAAVLDLQHARAQDPEMAVAQSLTARLDRLESSHNEQAEVLNQNLAAFRAALQHLELRINAIQLVVDDVVADDLTLLDTALPRRVPHWVAYQYTALQNIKRELEALKGVGNGSALKAPGPSNEGDATVEFGG